MDEIRRSLLQAQLSQMTIACIPHMDKDQRSRFVRDIENELRKLEKIYNINSMEDEEPEAGAFKKLRKLLNKR